MIRCLAGAAIGLIVGVVVTLVVGPQIFGADSLPQPSRDLLGTGWKAEFHLIQSVETLGRLDRGEEKLLRKILDSDVQHAVRVRSLLDDDQPFFRKIQEWTIDQELIFLRETVKEGYRPSNLLIEALGDVKASRKMSGYRSPDEFRQAEIDKSMDYLYASKRLAPNNSLDGARGGLCLRWGESE